jgi:hypothetical protein
MLRTRFLLAVTLVAAAVAVPATAAIAGSTPAGSSDPTNVTSQLAGDDGSGSNITNPSGNTGTDSGGSSSTDPSGSGSTTDPGATSPSGDTSGSSDTPSPPPPSLPDISQSLSPPSSPSSSSNPFSSFTDAINNAVTQLQSGSSNQPDLASALQTFGSCLQSAQTNAQPLAAGQVCFENFIAAITNDPRAHCFSENGFTLQTVLDRIQSGQPPSPSDQTNFQNMLAGLVSCLSGSSPSSGGGAAVPAAAASPSPAASSGEAPPATPVSGSPNFTG